MIYFGIWPAVKVST